MDKRSKGKILKQFKFIQNIFYTANSNDTQYEKTCPIG